MSKKMKTMGELRDVLFDELDKLRSGNISATRARTTALLAIQILDSLRVEMIYMANSQKGLHGQDPLRGLPAAGPNEISSD